MCECSKSLLGQPNIPQVLRHGAYLAQEIRLVQILLLTWNHWARLNAYARSTPDITIHKTNFIPRINSNVLGNLQTRGRAHIDSSN